ncbi:hypothetical protein Emtol_0374 [Emticicia oligotrophica DSM 17448]|uniref:Uncharacterized protein n=1 Tax=Emticicia oligotrophica (strain DSM 17448 / CIP 109782 / MTCC 6937 / GPTSA100-15) TaxID=929562 RepID=A0ABM5MWQ4_EMTOG|nr:hypothetical protein [Emticicia oligotrophica]AFK01528.1 hypothetical protein Emtol_0374 [Emticicia oligotrophica DSM 17448]
MNLTVIPEKNATELINQFHEIYPFLRLEIYYRGAEMSDAAHECLIKDIVHKKAVEGFEISPNMSVLEVETLFWEKMGLQVSIFRKSGKTWLESSFTNYWSLERQNILGRDMNDYMNLEPQKAGV